MLPKKREEFSIIFAKPSLNAFSIFRITEQKLNNENRGILFFASNIFLGKTKNVLFVDFYKILYQYKVSLKYKTITFLKYTIIIIPNYFVTPGL